MKNQAVENSIKALDLAGKTFRRYQEIHAAKPDPVKAQANADMAVVCEDALGGLLLEIKQGGCLHDTEGCMCI